MALSVLQLLYINNLLYSKSPSIYGDGGESFLGCTLGEFVRAIDPVRNRCGTADEREWARMVVEIGRDAHLCGVRVVNAYRDADTGDAGCLFADPKTGEAIVAFRGTGKGEWKDNFIAGAHMDGGADATISPQQQKALEYFASLDLSPYNSVTLTGHSKGGNKAKICALLGGRADRCISFDGQGFSDEFLYEHAAEVAANQFKIQNHNLAGDFVNILLNDVGETIYYEGQRVGVNFWKNHDPSAFLTDEGRMVPGRQNREMQEMDMFLNAMLRSAGREEKIALLAFTGEVTASLRGKDASRSRLIHVLCDPQNSEQFAFLLAYMLKYEHVTSRLTDGVSAAFGRMGLSEFNDILTAVDELARSEFSFGVFKNLFKLVDDIPNWIVSRVRDKFFADEIAYPFADAQIRQFLRVIARAGERIDEIEIEQDSGFDIAVDYTEDPLEENDITAGIEFARRVLPDVD